MAAPMRWFVRLNRLLNSTNSNLCRCANSVGINKNALALVMQTRNFHCHRYLRADKPLHEAEVKKLMQSLTDKFTEARELLNDARESEGTVYFSEDVEDAQEAVKDALEEYQSLLSQLSEDQRRNVIATLGLRMEELKAQQAAMEESLLE